MAARRLLAALLLLAGTLTPLLAAAGPALAAESPGARALDWAEAHETGCWYSWAGAGPCTRGFDCSGAVVDAFARTGIALPHSTYAMLASPRLHRIPLAGAPRGALMFYGTGHVEFNTAWYHMTYGAQHTGTRVGWHKWSAWWHPTMAFLVW